MTLYLGGVGIELQSYTDLDSTKDLNGRSIAKYIFTIGSTEYIAMTEASKEMI